MTNRDACAMVRRCAQHQVGEPAYVSTTLGNAAPDSETMIPEESTLTAVIPLDTEASP